MHHTDELTHINMIKTAFKIIFPALILSFISCNTSSRQEAAENRDDIVLTTDSLIDLVQQQTFQYFWEGADSHSGLARERIHIDGEYPQDDQNVITIGGSGFGLMSILVGIHNNYITRSEGAERIQRALSFLDSVDRFQGAWSHWYEGDTGRSKAFSQSDDGGDIVETAFLAQALITVREYFREGSASEQRIAQLADELWKGINWDFYRNGQDVLFWHWSPVHGWGMNHPVQGYDECLVAYILAASSPTHPIPTDTYHKGWARNGEIVTDTRKFDIPTVLKHNAKSGEVGPLFWAHYSYLGLNPLGLEDQYANYEDVVTNHARINIAYAQANPQNFKGYGADKGWGWTASYTTTGYTAHHPDNDAAGVIAPTAAISSIPYTPNESKAFIQYLFTNLKGKTWGKYGFYDAYSETEDWFPQRYLAIDQGPIVVMIQNHKDAFIWDLFMNAPDVQNGLKKLGFTSPYLK